MFKRLSRRASLLIARLGVFLVKRSGLYSGYFADWRWSMFDHAARSGLHILPVHYYSPVPDVTRIPLDDQRPRFLAAPAQTLDAAARDLEDLVKRHGRDLSAIADRKPYSFGEPVGEFRFGKAPYSTMEAELLYGLVRSGCPNRIVEIGCGHTTLLIAEAIRDAASDDYAPDFQCIEPYRPDYLRSLPAEVTGFRDTPLQTIPIDWFQQLGPGDILFIDSSHVVAYGSDAVYEMEEILPTLRAGVLVHFHDIFLPYDYPTKWLAKSRFFWNEQYMLSALLRDNPRYRIRYPLHQLYRERREEMERLFPRLATAKQSPAAYWVEIETAR